MRLPISHFHLPGGAWLRWSARIRNLDGSRADLDDIDCAALVAQFRSSRDEDGGGDGDSNLRPTQKWGLVCPPQLVALDREGGHGVE